MASSRVAALLAVTILCLMCPAGCAGPRPGSDETGLGPCEPTGPVRMTIESVSVPKKIEEYVRAITDEAEKLKVSGYVWSGKQKEIKLVIEGEKEIVNRFFHRIIEKGRQMRAVASYAKPKWSPATGRYKHFIWIFDPEPPE